VSLTSTDMDFEQPVNSFRISSPNTIAVYQELADYAFHNQPCLILGQSGVGKEYAARFYYDFWKKSENGSGEFKSLNCSLLAENIAHSELFGHVKGAFTGAFRDKKGFFELAQDGVLFLDEIGDLPLSVQPMLLRAIDPHVSEAVPLGGEKAVKTDRVRVLTATEMPTERIRPALLMRLGMRVTIPPLDERPEDRREAVNYFVLNALAKRRDILELHRELLDTVVEKAPAGGWTASLPLIELSRQLAQEIDPLAAQKKWPGNFRALRIAIDTAVVRAPRCRQIKKFNDTAVAFFNQHAPLYSEAGSLLQKFVPEAGVEIKNWNSDPLYRQVAAALKTATEDEKRQWTIWLNHNQDRTFRAAELQGHIQSFKSRTLQLRLNELIQAGVLEREKNRSGRYIRPAAGTGTMAVSRKRFQELFPLTDCAAAEQQDSRVPELYKIMANARHVFLADVNLEENSLLAIRLGHSVAGERTVYYCRLQEQGMEHLLDLLAAWFSDQENLDKGLFEHIKKKGLEQAALYLAGFADGLFVQDSRPLFIIDQLKWLRSDDDKKALETMLRFWPRLQFLLTGEKLQMAPEAEKEIGIVEVPAGVMSSDHF
jgi:DNA-binding NtrC family response regulator